MYNAYKSVWPIFSNELFLTNLKDTTNLKQIPCILEMYNAYKSVRPTILIMIRMPLTRKGEEKILNPCMIIEQKGLIILKFNTHNVLNKSFVVCVIDKNKCGDPLQSYYSAVILSLL